MSFVTLVVGRYTYPSSSSALMRDHTLPAPVYDHDSFSQVSTPGSPARGIGLHVQRSLPLRASNARTTPGAPSIFDAESWFTIAEPRTTMSRTASGAAFHDQPPASGLRPSERSIRPPVPNEGIGSPVF